jgi:hypothetical protein
MIWMASRVRRAGVDRSVSIVLSLPLVPRHCDQAIAEAVNTIIYAAPRTEVKELGSVGQVLNHNEALPVV